MRLDYCEAMARLEAAPIMILADWVYDSYKDFYGVRGRHIVGWSREDLIDWIKSHFVWDYDAQSWRNAVPFVGED